MLFGFVVINDFLIDLKKKKKEADPNLLTMYWQAIDKVIFILSIYSSR